MPTPKPATPARPAHRPRNPDREHVRTESLGRVRVSPAELAQLQATAATRPGRGLSAYVRQRLGLDP